MEAKAAIAFTDHVLEPGELTFDVIRMEASLGITPTNGMIHWRQAVIAAEEAFHESCTRKAFLETLLIKASFIDAVPRDFPSLARAGCGKRVKLKRFSPLPRV